MKHVKFQNYINLRSGEKVFFEGSVDRASDSMMAPT